MVLDIIVVVEESLKMSDQYLCNLRPFQQGIFVKVRIVRIWESIDPSRPDTLLSLDFLAIDAQRGAMHFMIRSSDASQFRPQLKEGCLYSIKKFQINNKKTAFNPIPSNIMGIFTKNTVIQTIQDNLDAYPANFIGALKSITTIEKVRLQNRTSDVKKRDLYIEDLSGNTLKVVLYGDKAEAIDEDQLLDKFISPIVIVAATTIKKYMTTKFYMDLNIPETMLHKQRYEKEPFSVQIINIHMSPQQLSTKEYEIKDSTLADINNADPTEVVHLLKPFLDNPDQEWHTGIAATTSKSSTPPPLTLGSSASKVTTEKAKEQLLPILMKAEMNREDVYSSLSTFNSDQYTFRKTFMSAF
ncbi:Uncharacterized protein TCM_026012 [Theobroma cacao]|uniref:Replication protein A 70 kDa DNA-binding subunit B/D first OB fold domain-containing protein n=1 Tax=Theobroma cacao TaxID=3641 RepID=A0A061F231_THECC|nr:Uncharacterized protein TCM_026012 [Theobroma cacao]